MNKKILICSIIAVAVLIGISFTSVVGYRSVESNVKTSPLFEVRTNRAIGEDSKVPNCKYAGRKISIPFPKQDDKSIVVQKVIDNIRKMDDKTFEKFILSILFSAQKDGRLNGMNPDEIREALNQFRNSDKPIPILDTGTKQLASYGPGFPCPITQGDCPVTSGYGLKGILMCLVGLLLLPVLLYLFLDWCFEGLGLTLRPLCIGQSAGCPHTLQKLK